MLSPIVPLVLVAALVHNVCGGAESNFKPKKQIIQKVIVKSDYRKIAVAALVGEIQISSLSSITWRNGVGRRSASGSTNDSKDVREAKEFIGRQPSGVCRQISERGCNSDSSLQGFTTRGTIVEGEGVGSGKRRDHLIFWKVMS